MGSDVRLERRRELAASWATIVERLGVLPRVFEVTAGRRVISQGQAPDQIYLVETGIIKLLHRPADGDEIVVGVIDDGCPLGTVAVALGVPNSVSALAITDATLNAIPAMLVCRAISQDVLLSDALLRINSLKLFAQLDRLALLAVQPARRRVECVLRQLAARRSRDAPGEDLRLDLPFSQCELASLVNLTPETLSRVMVDLERAGVIRRSTSRTLYLRARRTSPLDRDQRIA